MGNVKKSRRMLAAFVAALLSVSMLGAVATAEDTIKIGGLAPLTGEVAQYGIAVQRGVDLYVEQLNAAGGINGQLVEVIWEDEKGDPTEAVNAYNKLVENDGVVAIIGDVTTKPTLAVADRAAMSGIPMITASATAYDVTDGKDNVFRTCFLDPFQAATMANFAKDYLQATKVAIIYDNTDDYSLGLYDAFVAQVEANGQELVAEEASPATEVDYKALLTKISQGEPEVLFVAYYYTQAALIVQQANELGMDVKFVGADGINGIENNIADVSLLNDTVFYSDNFASDSTADDVVSFKEAFKAKYGEEISSAFTATGYDAALVLCEAIKNAGSTDYEAVVAAMKATNVTGITGPITFDDHNDPIKSAYIMTYQDGVQTFVVRQDP